jgi:hypothetical protein
MSQETSLLKLSKPELSDDIKFNTIPGLAINFQKIDDEFKRRSAKFYDVKDYLAKGDGATDDTDALQNLFNTVPSGSTIYFPDGTYLNRGLLLFDKARINIVSDGATLKLKPFTEANLLTLDRCPYSSISGLTLEGNKSNQNAPAAGKGHGLVFRATYFSTVIRCRIENAKLDGMQIIGYQDGATFRGCDEVHVNHCFIQSNGRDGLFVDSVADMNIDGNNIEFNGGNGVTIRQTTGIPSGNSNVINNQILSNDGHGMEVIDDTSRIFINLNHIRANGKMGIRLIGGKQFSICHNNIHLNGRLFPYSQGLIVGYTSKGMISNNFISCTDFTPTQGYGIELASCNRIIISENIVLDNLNAGLNISGDSTLITQRDNITT